MKEKQEERMLKALESIAKSLEKMCPPEDTTEEIEEKKPLTPEELKKEKEIAEAVANLRKAGYPKKNTLEVKPKTGTPYHLPDEEEEQF